MEDKTIVIGPKRGAKIRKRWDPTEWRPEYEAMVSLSLTGMPQSEIASRFGYTESWLSQIINSPKGKIVKQLIINKIREGTAGIITTERIQQLHAKAFTRIEEVISNDEIAERSPMAIFDASMKVLARGKVLGEADQDKAPIAGTVTNNTMNVFANGLDRRELDKSLEIANRVKELHSGEVK